ncbi:TIGR00341 family protein [Psychrobacter immobilis]|uniref:TIGR00341 family protein n=1 Tax=Psychrobacter immobilis TaxID=498 RepID=UPI001D107763|nr:TIGR00341 family protein [Psychrobacter immobilis]
MTSSENKLSNDSSVIKNASSTAIYPDKKTALTDADGSSVLDSTVEHTQPSKSSETRDDNDCGEDMACAQPPETTIAIKSIGADEVVATLETAKPNNESEITKLEITGLETPLSNESLKSTTAPNHQNLENVSAEHAQAEEDNASEQTSQEDADAEVTVEGIAPADVQGTYPISDNPQQESKANSDNTKPSSIDKQPDTPKNNDTIVKNTVKDKVDNQEELEDEIKEKKEAKLESYKQFVAEQFSNQKVDYPEVRVRIEANALPSKMYFIMNILSAIIASYGLVTNSAAVVIGAMLVAMMLGPITGIALAIIDHRMPLLRKSLITVIVGVSLVVLVGFIVGWLHKDQPLTAEILSRTQPTSMDLMIALAGGTAGAYAMVSPHLSVAVVGVAVATALVPPLAASGILFANGEIQLGFGALLLAVTNIIAIQFTNALVLWLLGFRRLVKDDYKSNTYLTFLQRNAVTLLLLAGLGTYLTINLQTNAKQQVFESSVKEAINSYFIDKGNVLTNTQFDTSKENKVVRAVIRGETTPTSYDVRQIETVITQDMAENFPEYLPIKLQLRYLPVQVIESNPLIQDKLDKTDAAILTN